MAVAKGAAAAAACSRGGISSSTASSALLRLLGDDAARKDAGGEGPRGKLKVNRHELQFPQHSDGLCPAIAPQDWHKSVALRASH